MKLHRTQLTPFVLALGLAACASDPGSGDDSSDGNEGWEVPSLNVSDFKKDVYPILIRDCGFNTCHGSEERYFRVWGPYRTRLDPTVAPSAGELDAEVNASMSIAVSMIDRNDPKRSLLLRKPLATEAGGMGHLGADKWGRNLYRSTDSQGYVTLSKWAFSVGQTR